MTALLRTRTASTPIADDNGQQVVLYDIPWRAYTNFCDALPDRYIRMTYDRGVLEIMTVSTPHERYKSLIGLLIVVLAEELNRVIGSFGSFTHRRKDLARALEPDLCFYLKHFHLVRGKRQIDLTADPPPDLAIEVEISRSLLNRMAILAALQVPEVWRFDGESFIVNILREGRYEVTEVSEIFPEIDVRDLVRFVTIGVEDGDLAMLRGFRTWLRRRRTRKSPSKKRKNHR